MLVLSVFISGELCGANSANTVEVDGDRLSVYAEGTTLGELLMVVEKMTGVQFRFDELMATKTIFLDFKGLLLSEGIKKIVYPLSSATIYDETGKLRRVIVLGRWKGSETGGIDPAESQRHGQSSSVSLPLKGGSDSSVSRKSPPLRKGLVRVGRHSMKRSQKIERPPGMQDPTMELPHVTSTSKADGPPVEQGETMDGPLDVKGPDYSSAPDSGGDASDGPPLDMPYVIDGPPDLGNQGMDGPPGVQDQ